VKLLSLEKAPPYGRNIEAGPVIDRAIEAGAEGSLVVIGP